MTKWDQLFSGPRNIPIERKRPHRRISSILHAHAGFPDQDGERPADELAIRSASVRRVPASRDG
jgi:hypothetical protein